MNDVTPDPPPESTRQIWAQALRFLGPILALGGLVAALRTRTTEEFSWFWLALIPIGLTVTALGVWLGTPPSDDS